MSPPKNPRCTVVLADYERPVEAGMRFHCPPQDSGDKEMGVATYGRDPDGNMVGLLEYFDPDHVESLKQRTRGGS